MKPLIILFCILLSSMTVNAQEWVKVHTAKTGISYIDADSVEKIGNTIFFDLRVVYIGRNDLDYGIAEMALMCHIQRIKTNTLTVYAGREKSELDVDTRWQDVGKGNLAETISRALCPQN